LQTTELRSASLRSLSYIVTNWVTHRFACWAMSLHSWFTLHFVRWICI